MISNPCFFPTQASVVTRMILSLSCKMLCVHSVFAEGFSGLKPTPNIFFFLEISIWQEKVCFSQMGKSSTQRCQGDHHTITISKITKPENSISHLQSVFNSVKEHQLAWCFAMKNNHWLFHTQASVITRVIELFPCQMIWQEQMYFSPMGKAVHSKAREISAPWKSYKVHKTRWFEATYLEIILHSIKESQPQFWFAMKSYSFLYPISVSHVTCLMQLHTCQMLCGYQLFSLCFHSLNQTSNIFSFLEKHDMVATVALLTNRESRTQQ